MKLVTSTSYRVTSATLSGLLHQQKSGAESLTSQLGKKQQKTHTHPHEPYPAPLFVIKRTEKKRRKKERKKPSNACMHAALVHR